LNPATISVVGAVTVTPASSSSANATQQIVDCDDYGASRAGRVELADATPRAIALQGMSLARFVAVSARPGQPASVLLSGDAGADQVLHFTGAVVLRGARVTALKLVGPGVLEYVVAGDSDAA